MRAPALFREMATAPLSCCKPGIYRFRKKLDLPACRVYPCIRRQQLSGLLYCNDAALGSDAFREQLAGVFGNGEPAAR
jgi:hypothetical protein